MTAPTRFSDADAVADAIIARVGKSITLALPLGLGKAVDIANALTRRAVAASDMRLRIFTALTLERPHPSGELQRRFLEPALDRLFGRYPTLLYAQMLRDGTLPDNVDVNEFFFLAGQWLGVERAQHGYISANYAQALHVLLDYRPNVVAQLVASTPSAAGFSLSCNPDITVDLLKARRAGRADFVLAAQVNGQLPFMFGEAVIGADEVDLLLDAPDTGFELYSAPKRPLGTADHAIGLHVSRLVRDGGTLQIGIGSIGDAVAHALILRHRDNAAYRDIADALPVPDALSSMTEVAPFEAGLYGVTEMLVDGFVQLEQAGILKREVDGAVLHAGFFVECRDFYARLKAMPDARRARFAMMPVSFTNTIHGDEAAKRAARVSARFVNNAMKATLLGAVVSDSLENGQVVSGVGGQFDFVAQAFALEGARVILTLDATRTSKGKTTTNIVWDHAHVTVPRHSRDIVATEYGVADLRGRADADVVAAMLSIADSRFQDGLLDKAKAAGKISRDYVIPTAWRSNTPGRLEERLAPLRRRGLLPAFPFGTDFTEVERRLMPALRLLDTARHSTPALARLAWSGRALPGRDAALRECLDRMGLGDPASLRDRIAARLLHGALMEAETPRGA